MTNDIDPYPELGYDQLMRPQFHFSSKKNWINDPNGLVWHEGEYHLFFQHNPEGWPWGNMTWGHAVSPDLVHWKQIQHAILPDELGTIYSGSAVIDHANSAGFQDGEEKAMVAAYTYAVRCVEPKKPYTQAIAYSTDRGRTFIKYEGNPVIDNITGSGDRDPKVFWYEPGGHWVMVLYLDDYDTLGIFSSANLKEWKLESQIGKFHECPELFELPVDPSSSGDSDETSGDAKNTRWVIYGANYEYYIGSFDGKTFTPDHESKYAYRYGSAYASQTFTDEPRGRRVQIGWGQVEMKEMPFNQMMTFPVELSLRTTDDGVRLFAEPVDELDKLRDAKQVEENDVAVSAEAPLEVKTSGDLFEVKLDIELGTAEKVGLEFADVKVVYDVGEAKLNDAPLKPVDGVVTMQILIDRSSIEVFANGGRAYLFNGIEAAGAVEAMKVTATGGEAKVVSLVVTSLKSAWQQ
jgi:fructan beta-fructosidase